LHGPPEIAARYNIRGIPTLILFRKSAILAQRAGTIDRQTLWSWARQYAGERAQTAKAS
jgi:thioredoxin 2